MSPKATGRRRGRPPKFDRPSRAVTLTLPDDVIAALQAVDTDLSLAVVRIADTLAPGARFAVAELASFDGRTVIVVPRSQVLKERIGVELVPLKDGRALMAFDNRVSLSELELRLSDALEDATVVGSDRALFDSLATILRDARRSDLVTVREPNIVIFADR